jgi:hypothetical protein
MKCEYCKRGGGNYGEPCKGCGYVPDREDEWPKDSYYNPLMQGLHMGSASCSAFIPNRAHWYGSGSNPGYGPPR